MMDSLLRTLFLWLARNQWLRRMATRFPLAYRFARRFIAGETATEALVAVRELGAAGILITLDILGEEVTRREEALVSRDGYLALLDQIGANGVASDISLKLTQMGLDIDAEFCVQNVSAIVARAQQMGVLVCIDMEDSPRTERTLEVWRRIRTQYPNVGIVIQAYLYRSEADIRALTEAGATVRLCKGAYKEPVAVAFPQKADVDANMIKLMQIMLDATARMPAGSRPYLAMATHDEKMIQATRAYADRLQMPRDAFEFQMLYGIRRDLQEEIAESGYRVRAYVPFGTHWYPYFMRRLAERPANVWFLLRALIKETPGASAAVAAIGVMLVAVVVWGLTSKKHRCC
jgi:proline dehydrogenase